MKERGIPFSTPMVRALLAGTKTQTRRVVHPQPQSTPELGGFGRLWFDGQADMNCPYGLPKDRLWVREAWRTPLSYDSSSGSDLAERCIAAGYKKPWAPIQYEADGARDHWIAGARARDDGPGRYRQARFMPRWASRILLEVTDVRVERLQDISADDCAAEGISVPVDARTRQVLIDISTKNGPAKFLKKEHFDGPQSREWFADVIHAHYAALWESINGAGSWDANPWVWAISFKRIGGEA